MKLQRKNNNTDQRKGRIIRIRGEEEEEYILEEMEKNFKLQNQFIFGFSPSHYVIYTYALQIYYKKHKQLGGETSFLYIQDLWFDSS